MIDDEFLRAVGPGDEGAVDALLRAAFAGEDEVALVHALRRERTMAGECVVPGTEGLLAYAGLSRMTAPDGWLCLAPVAVAPAVQGRGLGTRMVSVLAAWARLSDRTVVVLGDPDFYARAGFSRDRAARLRSPYPIDHTLIAGPGEDAPAATLVYPAAFG